MHRKHQKTLELIFARPVSGSIKWRDIGALLVALGADVTEREGSRLASNFLRIAGYFTARILRPIPTRQRWKVCANGQEPVGLGNRRLQIDRSGPFFTVFLTHSGTMGLQIRQKLSSLGPILAFDAPSPTGS